MGKRGPGTSEDKPWAEALRRATYRESEGKGSKIWLEVIANRCVADAVSGNVQSIKEIGDRLDGKAVQTTDGNLTHGVSDDLLAIIRGAVHGNPDTD